MTPGEDHQNLDTRHNKFFSDYELQLDGPLRDMDMPGKMVTRPPKTRLEMRPEPKPLTGVDSIWL
jgi:hypothetical protein